VRFEAMAAAAERLASYEAQLAEDANRAFSDARDTARRRMVAVALGAALVIILLLFTANDVARMALEGERRTRPTTAREPEGGQGS
jgi:ferric-dicitrate binding protein FerR (iron transport regulator)